MELEQLRELMRIFDAANVTELILEAGEERVVLRKGPLQPGNNAASTLTAGVEPAGRGGSGPGASAGSGPAGDTAGRPAKGRGGAADGAGALAEAERTHTVTSPMVAIFYRAAAPGAEPFVSVGDHVNEGQVLCILECMKVMNHMEAEASGRVREILAENGASVEYGQPLFVIEPDR